MKTNLNKKKNMLRCYSIIHQEEKESERVNSKISFACNIHNITIQHLKSNTRYMNMHAEIRLHESLECSCRHASQCQHRVDCRSDFYPVTQPCNPLGSPKRNCSQTRRKTFVSLPYLSTWVLVTVLREIAPPPPRDD